MKHLIVELVNNMEVPQAKEDTIGLNFFSLVFATRPN